MIRRQLTVRGCLHIVIDNDADTRSPVWTVGPGVVPNKRKRKGHATGRNHPRAAQRVNELG